VTGIRRRLAEKGSATTLAAAVDGFGLTMEFLNSSNYSSIAKQLLSFFPYYRYGLSAPEHTN
jgi:hypothetical protein